MYVSGNRNGTCVMSFTSNWSCEQHNWYSWEVFFIEYFSCWSRKGTRGGSFHVFLSYLFLVLDRWFITYSSLLGKINFSLNPPPFYTLTQYVPTLFLPSSYLERPFLSSCRLPRPKRPRISSCRVWLRRPLCTAPPCPSPWRVWLRRPLCFSPPCLSSWRVRS